MKGTIISFGIGLIAMTAIVAAGQRGGTTAAIKVGEPAPLFTGTDSNGKTINLADYKGKFVVLEWTNYGCPYVVRHYQGQMQATQKWAKEQGAVWIKVCSSAPGKQGHVSGDQANQQWKAGGWSIDNFILDPNGAIGRQYGARTSPHMYVIDPNGTLVYNGAIDDDQRGNNPNRRNHVKEALTEAKAGKAVSVATSQPYGCGIKY